MKEHLKLTEEILERRYSISDDLYGTMFLVCYGLISIFGEDYRPIIEKVIRDTEVYISDIPLVEMIEEEGFSADQIYGGEDLNNTDFSTTAASFPGHDIWVDKNGHINYYKDMPTVFCSTIGISYTNILNALIHEFGHLVKGFINGVRIEDNYFSIRSGLNVFGAVIDKDGKNNEFSTDLVMDEVINVFQTTDGMMEIAKLEGTQLHPVVQLDFDKLDLKRMDELQGYSYGTEALEKLWKNSNFRELIKDNIVTGEIDKIKNEFDSAAGYCAFDLLSDYLESLEYSLDEDERCELTSYIAAIVDSYNLGAKGIEKVKN